MIFVSAFIAGTLSSAGLSATAQTAAKNSEDCLSGPNGPAPAGNHWYYRLDRATKRQCWYVREATAKPARVVAAQADPQPTAAAETAPTPQRSGINPSVANARAELTWPQQAAAPQPPSPAADASAPSAATPSPAAPASSSQEEAAPVPQPAPPPHIAVPIEAAAGKQAASTQMLLVVMIGALALSGLIGAVMLMLNRRRKPREESGDEGRTLWDAPPADPVPLPQIAAEEQWPIEPVQRPRPQRVQTAPRARQPIAPTQQELSFDETQRQIKEMLARLARSAAA